MRFYTASKLGSKRALTPEGFLVCLDVPIARTGEMIYAASELGLKPGPDGLVRVQRDPDEVFKPEAMASFLGKPTTNNHPPVPVTPANYRTYVAGSAQNVRRGAGDQADLLLADLIFADPETIKAIDGGKDEISCGYDADYEETEPGRARQVGIVGNHVALVDEGRCGPRCSIGDSASTEITPAAAEVMAANESPSSCGCGGRHINAHPAERKPYMAKVKKSAFDRLRAAFATKDEKAFEEEVSKVQDDVEEIQEAQEQSESEKKLADMITAAVTSGIKPLSDRLDALEAKMPTVDEDGEKTDEEKAAEAAAAAVAEAARVAAEKVTADEAEKKAKEEDKATADSAGLAVEFQDAVARAEIIAPGVKLPTYDGKATRKTVADHICALRRKALVQAHGSADHKGHVTPFVTDAAPDFARMSCDAVKMVFTGASELAKAANNRASAQTSDAASPNVLMRATIADMNKSAREFWKPKR